VPAGGVLELGEAEAELLGEKVATGRGPLAELDESRAGNLCAERLLEDKFRVWSKGTNKASRFNSSYGNRQKTHCSTNSALLVKRAVLTLHREQTKELPFLSPMLYRM
jgi:hypothetical protein